MNLADLQKKLLAAARRNAPGDQVPYAFEKRVMAHLVSASKPDEWALWGRALWGGALACAFVALLAGALSIAPLRSSEADLSQDLEQTILASADDFDTAW